MVELVHGDSPGLAPYERVQAGSQKDVLLGRAGRNPIFWQAGARRMPVRVVDRVFTEQRYPARKVSLGIGTEERPCQPVISDGSRTVRQDVARPRRRRQQR